MHLTTKNSIVVGLFGIVSTIIGCFLTYYLTTSKSEDLIKSEYSRGYDVGYGVGYDDGYDAGHILNTEPDEELEQTRYYLDFPTLPDFYYTVDGSDEITVIYNDTKTEDEPLTWHYRVRTNEIANELMNSYENALLEEGTWAKTVNYSQTRSRYYSLNTKLVVTVWTNEVDRGVYINISIAELEY
jgi:hypothetical protein